MAKIDIPAQISQDMAALLPADAAAWPIFDGASAQAFQHLPYLFWLTQALRPQRVVQLGIADGAVYFGLCQAMQAVGATGTCLGLNGQQDAPPLSFALLEHNIAHYGAFSRVVSQNLVTAAAAIPTGSVDLLVINLDLSAALADMLCQHWRPRLSERAVIVLIGDARSLSAPKQGALGLICLEHPIIKPDQSGGLLTVLAGSKQPDIFLDLAALPVGSEGLQTVHQAFGQAVPQFLRAVGVSDHPDGNDLAKPNAAAGQIITEPRSVMIARIEDLGRQLHERLLDIAVLTDHFEARNTAAQAALETQKNKLLADQTRLQALEQSLNNHLRITATQRAEITALKTALADSQQKRASHWKNLEAERKTRAAEREKATEVKRDLHEAQNRVTSLLSSTSWKVTRPLRALGRIVRRR